MYPVKTQIRMKGKAVYQDLHPPSLTIIRHGIQNLCLHSLTIDENHVSTQYTAEKCHGLHDIQANILKSNTVSLGFQNYGVNSRTVVMVFSKRITIFVA